MFQYFYSFGSNWDCTVKDGRNRTQCNCALYSPGKITVEQFDSKTF